MEQVGSRRLLGRSAECAVLDRVLADALAGRSSAIVLRGEAGIGKTALLQYVAGRADGWHVVRAAGVESEMELAYGGMHQLCAPMLTHLDGLPGPQREALDTVFGRSDGDAPDRFLVGLATLTLFAEAAEQQALLCIVDDAQWLDEASAQILGFVARRLFAEKAAIVCALRTGTGDRVLADLPALELRGLDESDARALLLDNVHGPLDAAVCAQIIAESHGNPLALLELPRTWPAADLAGGFALPDSGPVAGAIEQSYGSRLEQLPADTRLLVLTAAAEPLGDPVLLHRATETLGVKLSAADPALDAGLIRIGGRVEFAHPLVRSAAYRASPAEARHRVHRALADATDADLDPDRRAWHRARATAGLDEEVADELEQSAGRARSRGGLAAAAAFLERSTALSVEPSRRVERALNAAQLKYEAGSIEDALGLLAAAEAGALDDLQRGQALLLRARIEFASRRRVDAHPLLLAAARDLEAVDVGLARLAYLEAFHAALHAGRLYPGGLAEVSLAALACPAPPSGPRPRDLLLDGLATRVVKGYAAGAPILKETLSAFCREAVLPPEDAGWLFLTFRIASDLWDEESHMALSVRELECAREAGALTVLPRILDTRSVSEAVAGELDRASATIDQMRSTIDATGIASHGDGFLLVAALRGRESEASHVIEHAAGHAAERGEGLELGTVDYARSVLYNGLGRYDAALAAVREAPERPYEIGLSRRAVAELVEAAARCGEQGVAGHALECLVEMTRASGTDWALGIEARSRAQLAAGDAADRLYRESIERIESTSLLPDLARSHLVYGEWLRREGRRVDAREHLRTAHELHERIGMEAFAERARRELLATGEKVRKRVDETRGQLTPQEQQIARLARDGLTNPEIGAMLFLSPRTVEWHLRKVFTKLGIGSRGDLRSVLATPEHA